MKKYHKILKLCFLFIFFALLFYYQTLFKTSNHIHNLNRDIVVQYMTKTNYSSVSKDDIIQIATQFLNNIDSLEIDINTSMLEDLILDNKYIKKAEVYLDVEGTVNIFIYFREPFVRLLRNNETYYYSSDWEILPILSNVDKNLLVVSGDLNKQEFVYLSELVNKIYKDNILNQFIGGIHYNNQVGYILSPKVCDIGINIGKTPKFNKYKINMLQRFYNYILNELGCNYCRAINLQYDNQVICIK